MSKAPYSEESTINIDGEDCRCVYYQKSTYSWSGILNRKDGKTHQVSGLRTKGEVERALKYQADE